MTATERQQKYRAKRRAEGVCLSCELYTPINPKTGKPYWHCGRCRLVARRNYREYQVQEYPWQLSLREV